MSGKEEVTILGGGVLGFTVAYHLAKEGVPCQVIEMDSIASKASGRASGNLAGPCQAAVFFATPFLPKGTMTPCLSMFDESFTRHRELPMQLREEGKVDVQYGESTRLFIAIQPNEEKDLKKLVAEAQSKGFEACWLDKDGARVLGPFLAPDVRGAALVPQAQVESYRFSLAVAQAAEARGVTIKYNQATGFRCQNNRVRSVILSSGEIDVKNVVIALGPWSTEAASWLGVKISMDIIRGQNIKVKVPRRLPTLQYAYAGTSALGKVDGSVILGYIEDRPEGFDDSPTEEAKETMIEGTLRLIPELEAAEVIEARAGLMAFPTDGLPIMGRLPGWDNAYIATGLGTIGITLSPAVGRMMADLIIRDKSEKVMEKLSPARFRKET